MKNRTYGITVHSGGSQRMDPPGWKESVLLVALVTDFLIDHVQYSESL